MNLRNDTPTTGGRLAPDPVKRRDFLGLSGLWAAGVAICGSLVGMMRLPRPRVLPEPSGKFKLGYPEDWPPGTVQIIPGKNLRVESSPDGITALSLSCTHLGCIVQEEHGRFVCPCHGSHFEADGKALKGPAPRGLRWLEVSQAPDGSLLIDITREVPAGSFYKV